MVLVPLVVMAAALNIENLFWWALVFGLAIKF